MRAALPFVSPRVYAAGIWFEALLGLWLLSGIAPAWSWLCSTGFLSILAYLSARLGFLGQASCGCFGRIVVSPWWALAIDVACLAALFVWRPRALWAGIRAGLAATGVAAVIVAALLGIQSWRYGSLPATLAHMRGETNLVRPMVADVGVGRAGDTCQVHITLTNYGAHLARIVGGTNECACVATDDLPIDLPPGQSRSIVVRFTFAGSLGRFQHSYHLFIDQGTIISLPGFLTGRVIAPVTAIRAAPPLDGQNPVPRRIP